MSATTNPSKNKEQKKTRVVNNRRARARGPQEEDDEDVLERAALSDTDSEISETDTDTAAESDSEVEEQPSQPSKDHKASNPALSQPPPEAGPSVPSAAAPPKEQHASPENLRDQDKAEDNGDEQVPVIDFADISKLAVEPAAVDATKPNSKRVKPPKKVKKSSRKKKPAAGASKQETTTSSTSAAASKPDPDAPESETQSPEAAASTSDKGVDSTPSTSKPAPPRETVRQAYLKKLNEDPSFVPTVGQFWGHDDRLMSKEMRGMSDWWRGRWISRGRGGGFRGRGRGRGGFGFGGPVVAQNDPLEKTWGHDGYEELLRQEDSRGRGRGGSRGRGFSSRARGPMNSRGGRGAYRGTTIPNSAPSGTSSTDQAQDSAASASQAGPSTNAENAASSQLPPATQPSTEPGTTAEPKRTAASQSPAPSAKGKQKESQPPARTRPPGQQAKLALADAYKDHAKVVPKTTPHDPNRLNTASGASSEVQASNSPKQSTFTGPGPSGRGPRKSTSTPQPSNRASHLRAATDGVKASDSATESNSKMDRVVSENGAPAASVPTNPQASEEKQRDVKVPPNAAASSTTHPSVTDGATAPPHDATAAPNTPYSYMSLPPGLAMGESGLVYEIATNRPVMLNQMASPPPPPPGPAPSQPSVPVYTPRPIVHSPLVPRSGSVSYLPPHMMMHVAPPSMTPEYPPSSPYGYSQSPVGDSMRATPNFFTPPRQSGRVQIRAPTNGANSNNAPKQFNGPESSKSAPNSQTEPTTNHMPGAAQSPGSAHRQFVPSMDGSQNSNPYAGVPYGAPEPYGYPGYYPPTDPSRQPPAYGPVTDEYGYGGYYPVDPNYGYVAGGEYGMPYPGQPPQGRAGEGYQNGHVDGLPRQQSGPSQLQPSPAYY
ncbi:hypothetical protein FRC02_010686 [Tulasnella sp. 418]|nr:hypothetical protein FRC02_010686 [Tulasnella sp. 418]